MFSPVEFFENFTLFILRDAGAVVVLVQMQSDPLVSRQLPIKIQGFGDDFPERTGNGGQQRNTVSQLVDEEYFVRNRLQVEDAVF